MSLTSTRQSRAIIGDNDPLHYDTPLPLRTEYFPMGQSFRIATNSRLVHAVAESMWSRFRPLSNESALRLHIEVNTDELREGLAPPVLRARGHLVSMITDSRNFVNADLRAGFAFAHFTQDLVGDTDYWRYHFLEPLACMMTGAHYFTYLHASCVSRYGRAIVLCGDSGAGKTCLAFACARRGWTFHSGDATAIVRNDVHRIVGRPFEIRFRSAARQLFGELWRYPPAMRPNNKYDIELDPRDLGLAAEVEGHARHIVFLNRSPDSVPASVVPFSKSEALCRLEQNICFGDKMIRGEQRDALAGFLTLPVWQLTYSDWGDAEETLRLLVDRN
jgi:hypothetical protein